MRVPAALLARWGWARCALLTVPAAAHLLFACTHLPRTFATPKPSLPQPSVVPFNHAASPF